jgi:hypothetical protein
VDIIYNVAVFTINYRSVNDFNKMLQDKFKAIECYIRPNGHFMSLYLEDVSDESKHDLDDKKFYSQSIKIKCKAYIIDPAIDFRVERIPTRQVCAIDKSSSSSNAIVTVSDIERKGVQEINLNLEFNEDTNNSISFS